MKMYDTLRVSSGDGPQFEAGQQRRGNFSFLDGVSVKEHQNLEFAFRWCPPSHSEEITSSELVSCGKIFQSLVPTFTLLLTWKKSLVNELDAKGINTDGWTGLNAVFLLSMAFNVLQHCWLKMWMTSASFLVMKSLLESLFMISLMWSKISSMNNHHISTTTKVQRQNLRSFLQQQLAIKINLRVEMPESMPLKLLSSLILST